MRVIICAVVAIMLCHLSPCWAETSEEKIFSQLLTENDHLFSLDESLNIHYQFLLLNLSKAEKEALRNEQRAWLKTRNQTLHDIKALEALYEARLNVLFKKAKPRLHEILAMFLRPEAEIDLKNPELRAALETCNFKICQVYLTLILLEENQEEAAKKQYQNIIKTMTRGADDDYREDHEALLQEAPIDGVLKILTFKEVYHAYDYLEKEWRKLPLWLVVKHPQILDQYLGRFFPEIIARNDFQEYKQYSHLQEHINEMWRGGFRASSYPNCNARMGTMYLDLAEYYRKYIYIINFVPALLLKDIKDVNVTPELVTQNLLPLKAWSLGGVWEQTMYQQMLVLFEEASQALAHYYEQDERLKPYAPYATYILSTYIFENFPARKALKSDVVFQTINQIHTPSIEVLERLGKDFTADDWNRLLPMAILADYPIEIIKWLIVEKHADVNYSDNGETPLMKAVKRLDVLQLLLEYKADLQAKNKFGKTALFYAIQFGGQDALAVVKYLLREGANVNDQIDSYEVMVEKTNHECNAYMPEKVLGFTPLVYAKRYATQDIVDLLIAHGATLGGADPKAIETWISERGER